MFIFLIENCICVIMLVNGVFWFLFFIMMCLNFILYFFGILSRFFIVLCGFCCCLTVIGVKFVFVLIFFVCLLICFMRDKVELFNFVCIGMIVFVLELNFVMRFTLVFVMF